LDSTWLFGLGGGLRVPSARGQHTSTADEAATRGGGVERREWTITLIKKKVKHSSYIRKFRVEQLQSHICMRKGFLIFEEIKKNAEIFPHI
jgi:hypothetical protein